MNRLWAGLYALALRTYPTPFRSRHGAEMDAVLDERWHEEVRGRGALRASGFWLRMIALTVCGGLSHRLGLGWGGRGAGSEPAAGVWMRDALRSVRRAPAVAATAVGALGLTLGACIVLAATWESLLLRPLPFPESERIVRVSGLRVGDGEERPGPLSVLDIGEIRSGARGAALVAARSAARPVNVREGDRPRAAAAEFVETAYFDIFGVEAAVGRRWSAGESADPASVVVSHALWSSVFSGDPGAVGSGLRVNERSYTVVGVMPPGFRGDSDEADLWLPMDAAAGVYDDDYLTNRRLRWLGAVARLEAGVDPGRWAGELEALVPRLRASLPEAYEGRAFRVEPLVHAWYGSLAVPTAFVVAGAVLAFLLVCLGVTNLILTRSMGRRTEFSVRRTLGAGDRLVRGHLAGEAALMVGGGLILGLMLATAALPALSGWVERDLGRSVHLSLSLGAVVAGSVLATVAWAAVAAASAAPLRRLSFSALRGARGAGGSRVWSTTRRVLVAGQVAIAFVLTISSLSLARHLEELQRQDLGFDPDGLMAHRVDLLGARYEADSLRDETVRAFVREAGSRWGNRVAVSGPGGVPAGELFGYYFSMESGAAADPDARHLISYHLVSPSWLEVTGGRLSEGRWLRPSDDEAGRPVAVVTRALARRFWPNGDAVGRGLRMGSDSLVREVVGVVDDVRFAGWSRTPDLAAPEHIFIPILQVPPESPPRLQITVRDGLGDSASPDVPALLADLDPTLPVTAPVRVDARLRDQTWRERTTGVLTTGFAALALLISVAGVFSIVTQDVRNRRRELAVHMALGADGTAVAGMILRRVAGMVGGGVAAGLVATILLDGALRRAVFGASLTHVAALAAVASALLVAGGVAAVLPTRAAVRARPASALRED